MLVVEVLERMGGVATRGALIRATSRAAVDAALGAEALVVLAPGRYALASADDALKAAHRLTGVASHESAALRHGWAVLHTPTQPHVTLPRNRVVTDARRRGVVLHRAELSREDVTDGVTRPDRTLVDCLRNRPFLDALAVADSALRAGYPRQRLVALARDLRGPGSAVRAAGR